MKKSYSRYAFYSGRRGAFLPALLLLFFFQLFSQAAAAQQNSLSGTVTDPAGAAVAGAAVTAVTGAGTLSGVVRQTTTDAQGKFAFAGLPAGNYRVTVTAKGFAALGREAALAGDAAGARAPVELNFQLTIGAVGATVTVETGAARAELERVPGGTALLPRREIQQTLATNLKDVLNFTPGVLAQPRYGSDEIQISVRGSGLRNNYHLRGINVLVNGLPYGDADGFSDFEALEFLTAERIEVWKGANALRYGGNSAGGAINLVTETGETAFPLEVRLQGGAYGSFKGYVSTGGKIGRVGYFLGMSDTEFDGYREHSTQGRRRLFANTTYEYDENTDFYADVLYANFGEKLPGALTFADFRADPRQSYPEYVINDWGRFVNYTRASLGARRRFGKHEISLSGSGQYRDLIHPIFQVLDQDTVTFSGEIRYSYTGVKNRLAAGFMPQVSLRGERRYENLAGTRGPAANNFEARATNYGLYIENQHDFTAKFTLVTGARFDQARRRLTDRFLANGDQSDDRGFRAFSPKIGFVYRPRENSQIFANVSRSYEPPIIGELASYGAPGFLPLAAQDTWQFELGTRGSAAGRRLNYEIAFFDSEIRNEVINSSVRPFPGAPFTIPSFRSAPKTRHAGMELVVDAALFRDLFTAGSELNWRTAYTLSDFKFTEDADYEGNFIPGAPRHLLRSELRFQHPRGFWLAPNVDWSPAAYFVDSANTVRNDSYAVFNVRAGFDRPKYGVFFEAHNLADRIYSASVQVDAGDGRFFEPANGRSAFVGFYYRLGK